jgi:carbon-monoxide dehydrogenase medium subunit
VKPVAFDYVAARSLDEALDALAGGDEDAKPIAGGLSLVPALNMRLVRPTLLVDLNRAGLDAIEHGDGVLRVGATVRQAVLEADPRAHPLLCQALPHVGHFVTRNRGTIGGSVAHADGSAEIPVCLAAVGGTVVVEGPSGRRELDPADFFVTHYLTALQPGELVVETAWPDPARGEGFAFEEFSLRSGDYALSMIAVVLRREGDVAREVRIVAGAVTDRPTPLAAAAAALDGAPVTAESALAAGEAAGTAVDPAGSIHASPDYLRSLTATLVERAALRAWAAAA